MADFYCACVMPRLVDIAATGTPPMMLLHLCYTLPEGNSKNFEYEVQLFENSINNHRAVYHALDYARPSQLEIKLNVTV